jgi:hypothetical protein
MPGPDTRGRGVVFVFADTCPNDWSVTFGKRVSVSKKWLAQTTR